MKASSMNTKNKESGAVSLFIVIFTMLLVTIITLSFIRIMLSDQRQATAADLSQSAYDSAQAGVEDAKRAILYYQAQCAISDADCDAALLLMNSSECNKALSKVVDTTDNKEVLVQQSDADNAGALQQAYTCVKIAMQTDDYIGELKQDESKIVPLAGVDTSFDTVHLEWFDENDIQNANTAIDVPDWTAKTPLISQTDWLSVPNRPSLVRAQLMQFGGSFALSDFDGGSAGPGSNANTLFLYPSTIPVGGVSTNFTGDIRKSLKAPNLVHCESNLNNRYACSADLVLPEPIGGGTRTAFLRLTGLYKTTTNYRITLKKAGTAVQFNGVQPMIDSTGRANDLFRRIQSRVEVSDTSFPYPDAAVDTTDDFCKDFLVTNLASDYVNSCTP